MLVLNQIAYSIGPRVLFEEVKIQCQPGQRAALIGANGAGKSTLLQIISGHIAPSSGTVDFPKGTSIGFLRQDQFHFDNELVLHVVMAGKESLAAALAEKETLLTQETLSDQDGYRLGELEEIIINENGYTAEADAERILLGLGIPAEQHILALKELSGGWKLRVLLAQALFKDPDILLLDEPTNHLDIASIAWLGHYLKNTFSGVLLFISHDRSFINDIATDIFDIDYRTVLPYPGNYETFVSTKEEALIQAGHALKQQQARVAELQAYVNRFGAKASKAKQAKSRLKMIERIELTDIKQTTRRTPYFGFQQATHSGKQVLSCTHIQKQFDDHVVLKDISFDLMKGQRCAIIGPNGVGKSTLLNILTNRLAANGGEFQWHNMATVGYFEQEHHQESEQGVTLLSYLTHAVAKTTEQSARQALGKMLFSGDDVHKTISVLSGGELARLMFAKLLLAQDNVLILDEPTNHLDLESIDGLSEGLIQYPGSVLFVSHNRYFVELVATHLLIITPQGIDFYPGTYGDYMQRNGTDYWISE